VQKRILKRHEISEGNKICDITEELSLCNITEELSLCNITTEEHSSEKSISYEDFTH
jgi:hypothetical protein